MEGATHGKSDPYFRRRMRSSKEPPLEFTPRSQQKILDLIQRGVDVPNPLTPDFDEEV
jgi:hypothetical protein